MLAPRSTIEESKSDPEVGPQMSKPEEDPREGSHIHLEQSIGKPLEWKLLTADQLKELHEKLQLKERTIGWEPELKTKLHELVKEYFLFAMNSMDLGKTDLIQHHIELTDYTPIKDRYRQIPPLQYDDVHNNLQEMLEIGAIWKLNSLWASPIVLVH